MQWNLRTIPPQKLPISSLDRYEPYPFIPREKNTLEYEYIQTVNHCEVQYTTGEVFVFKSIEETMEWLNEKENKGALLIAHCGGSFDFQLILRQFLVSGQLRLKKVKNPLLRGNKIISAQIQNNIKLIDSYAFVASALSKFPKIFNIEEEERILSSPLQPGIVLSLQRINTFFRMVQSRTAHSRQKKRVLRMVQTTSHQ